MKFFLKIYSEDFDSSSSTIPLSFVHPGEPTLAELKSHIEAVVTQPQVFKRKNQLISVESQGNLELLTDDTLKLSESGIVAGCTVHLQDERLRANAKKKKMSDADWASMLTQKKSDMYHIDHLLLKFIEHSKLFEFIDVYKVYLTNEQKLQESVESLGGKTFLHFAVENSSL
mmetsp:Transcript_3680/g.5541  ORF Transcript_3680/g.5541 Transcript_3680/m.5541 type:complete len:172 (+) Transcript_3680:23-538(+)